MKTSENFLRAALNSIKARIKKTIIYSAYETANFMKEAPDLIKKEWNEFKKEVSLEAEKIEDSKNKEVFSKNIDLKIDSTISTQNKIDNIRKKIAKLNDQCEGIN